MWKPVTATLYCSMPYDLIQGLGQGHEGLKVAKMTNFVVYLRCQYACNQKTNGG